MNTQTSSPDFLPPPQKGKGVRRLNRLPLFIVAGLILLAVVGITYTMWQRGADMRSGGSGTGVPTVVDATMTPLPPPTELEPPVNPTREPLVPPNRPDPLPIVQTSTSARSSDLDQRLRLIARLEESRYMSREAALISEPVVPGFSRTDAPGAAGDNVEIDDMPGADARLEAIAGARALAQGGRGRGNAAGGLDPAAAMLASFGQTADANRQDEKRAFLSGESTAATYLPHTRVPALSPTEVKAGTVIPGVMIGGVNSDLPGQIIGQVRQNIYDTASGMHLLIPAGARLVGTYDSSVTMGQRRVLVAWNRIIFPDGSSVSLDMMPGADLSGYAGFKDKVNNHYWRIFGNAFMLSLFSAGIQLSQPDTAGGLYDSQQILAAEIGRQLGQLGMEMSRRNLDIQPTLEIRPGYQFNIMVTKDMILPPWQGHPLAAGQR